MKYDVVEYLLKNRWRSHLVFVFVFSLLYFSSRVQFLGKLYSIWQILADTGAKLLIVYCGMFLTSNWIVKNRLFWFCAAGLLLTIPYNFLMFHAAPNRFGWSFWGAAAAFAIDAIFLYCLGAGLSFAKSYFLQKKVDSERKEALKETELQFLRSQVSPHFIFNTLNNLYGLSLSRSPLLPALLLKLSELLRYSLYDTAQPFVRLEQELAYLRNYLELEKVRSISRLQVNLHLPDQVAADLKIAPMILIVFIENAFKHSRHCPGEIFIELTIRIENNTLWLHVHNSACQQQQVSQFEEPAGGLGLENVQKRLRHLYPQKHRLTITSTANLYTVDLALNLRADEKD